MIADEKKRLFKRNVFQVGIKNPSEKGSENKGGYYEFEESAEHQSIFSRENNVHFHLLGRQVTLKNNPFQSGQEYNLLY
jgi:hypothetical protein